MKKTLLLFLVLCTTCVALAQVGIGTTIPNTTAALEVYDTDGGILVPRMSQIQRNAITTPAIGLLIYQLDNGAGFYYYNGTNWTSFGGNAWDINGNSGTNPTTNKIGTTDVWDFIIKTNNIEAFRITSTGNIGIGTTIPTSQMELVSTPTINFEDGFESGTLANFTTGGDANWSITSTAGQFKTGAFAAKSGNIADKEKTYLQYMATIPAGGATLSFAHKQDAQSSDELHFYINGATQNSSGYKSPSTWTTLTFQLPAGTYPIRWVYEKSPTTSSGADEIYLDDISITTATPMLQIQDGNQADGYILLSDANGNATWTDPATLAIADDDWAFNSGSTNTDPMYRTGKVRIGRTGIHSSSALFTIDNGLNNGTEIGLGSDEYFVDGDSEFFVSHNIVPINDNSISIGTATLYWSKIYANNVTNTSDRRDKENIKPLAYGLNDLLKLRPVSYQWKEEKYGKTIVKDHEKLQKIGFIAQELQYVLPEAVHDKDWELQPNNTYLKVNLPTIGVSYHEVIPVIIKATQEHQKLIEATTKQLKEINRLMQQLKTDQ